MIAVGHRELTTSAAASQSMRSGSTPVHKDPVGSSPMLSKLKPWQLAILICLAVSILDQITKGILPTREINPIEWMLDAVGYVSGVGMVGSIINRIK